MRPKDEAEFEAFVIAVSSRLLRSTYAVCRDRELAEDAVQAALTSAYVSWRRVKEATDPEAHVRRMAFDHLSARRRRHPWTVEVLRERAPEVERSTEPLDGWTADLVDVRRRVRRRARVRLAVAGGTVVVALAVVAAAVTDPAPPARDTSPPVARPDGALVVPADRDDTVVLTLPTTTPALGEIRLAAEIDSDDPSYDGDGELVLSAEAAGFSLPGVTCLGAKDVYWELLWSNNSWTGRCGTTADEPTWEALWAPAVTDPSWRVPRPHTVRLALYDRDPALLSRCRQRRGADCTRLEPARVDGEGLRLGISLWNRPLDPLGVRMGHYDVAAVTEAFEHVTHRLAEVVAAPDGARRLVHTLEPSDHERMVIVPATGGESDVLSLEVDGKPQSGRNRPDVLAADAARIPPGGEHDVVVATTGFTPDVLGFVVYEKVDR